MDESHWMGPLDATDRQLIALLRDDGRASNRLLASSLGLSEATVGARIRRLDEAGMMRVVAVTDYRAFGYELFVMVGVTVEGRPVREIAEEVAAIEECVSVAIVFGPFDLLVHVLARDTSHLAELVSDRLAVIRGVRSLDSQLALDVVKYRADGGVLR